MAGVVPALLAATAFAAFQMVNRRALSGIDPYRGTGALVGVGAVVLGLVSLLTEGPAVVTAAPSSALGFAAAAGFLHFVGGWTLLGFSQLRVGTARTGVLLGTVPLFGALIAAITLDESLTGVTMLGLVVVTTGVGIVVTARTGAAVDASRRRVVAGVAAGLGTALCWSSSPVLIRRALEGLPSPVTVAAVGMAACATGYVVIALLTRRVAATRTAVPRETVGLLVLAGSIIAFAIWMQWTALSLSPVAVVLTVAQLTPPLVVFLSLLQSGEAFGRAATRVWLGTFVTIAGSLVVILTP